MALSLDALNLRRHATPPAAPLPMPEQAFDRFPMPAHFASPRIRTRLARLLTFGGAAALTAYAAWQMFLIVSLGEITLLQWVMVVLFSVTFGWIALSCTSAIAGMVFGRSRPAASRGSRITTRTALVMPVFNEEPASTFALLRAMGVGLLERDLGKHFEIFVISDTTNPDIWVQETAAFQALRDAIGAKLPIWYRHRHDNTGKKAGNIHDFVTRWGARYDFMIVLDADSLLSTTALETLVREMEADPACGILQSVPRLYRGRTLFGRLQQFASTVYGPVVARGVSAWQGDDGNYWGHNAIIRVASFASAAGLPKLAGRKPFGGEITSHDFVEAALVRRAGWSVRMLTIPIGSWEESPPSLLDVAARDRRWAQGNLQHLAVLRARGLRWPSRVHFLIGVMSYLASPLWLALIVTGLAITAHGVGAEIDYFTEGLQLFPTWPVFDSERMVAVFILTMIVLLLPKALGLVYSLFNERLRRGIGVVPLIVGVVVETVFSVLYAPIFMLIQSRQIWDILWGRDSGWSAQQRAHHTFPWSVLFRRHSSHTIIGLAVTGLLAYISMPILFWMLPTLVGLILAIPLSALSGSVLADRLMRTLRLLRIPEEVTPSTEMRNRERFEAELTEALANVTLKSLLMNDRLSERHFATTSPIPSDPRGEPNLARVAAALKIAEAEHCDEALDWFTTNERIAVLTHSELFAELATRPVAPMRVYESASRIEKDVSSSLDIDASTRRAG